MQSHRLFRQHTIKVGSYLIADLNGTSPPNFAWFTPNNYDNMHQCNSPRLMATILYLNPCNSWAIALMHVVVVVGVNQAKLGGDVPFKSAIK